MGKIGKAGLALLLAALLVLAVPIADFANAEDRTSNYRVYQHDRLLMEFARAEEAIAYAKQFSESHVEEIGSRNWVWDNYPRYQLYQLDVSLPGWKFHTLEDAKAEAVKWGYSSIRDHHTGDWVWNNFPKYRVYQGDKTYPGWEFTTLEAAIREAVKWANSHIIRLTDNRWVWDNLTEQQKQEFRQGPKVYRVYQGEYSADDWVFAYLEDAVAEALKWAGSTIIHTGRNELVFDNRPKYQVYQFDNLLKEFVNLEEAVAYARYWYDGSVRMDGRIIWTNVHTYTIYQDGEVVGEAYRLNDAIALAKNHPRSVIRNLDGTTVWSNSRELLFWGWNGYSGKDVILEQTANTIGLDIDSPSWFQLADASGNLKDTSSKETVDLLKQRGYEVHPLVSNQFDSKLTTAFLNDPAAQDRFIRALVDRSAVLGVDGINLDFENVAGSNRDRFTAFVSKLTAYAHEKGLVVSIDLPRGSDAWNHLTAFDHEKLAGIVDYIIIMAYDHHYSGSDKPGPVAGLAWTEGGVREFLSYGIPRDKLILGIPLYVREWTLDGAGKLLSNRAIYTKDIPELMTAKKAVKTWDDTYGQYKVEYTDEHGRTRVFWLEDETTFQARLDIARKYDLAGIAVWRLGQEDRSFWETVYPLKLDD